MSIDPFVDQFINNLNTQFSNGWAPYLFHYSDILNIVSVLETGALYSRNHCENNNLLVKDSGGVTVLNHTADTFKDNVRLYFRPKTPPFYRKEGFCPNDNQDSEFRAHCPVPIYLLFDSKTVLSSPQVKFSNGNLSKSPDLFDDKRDLNELDFGQIYHSTHLNNIQHSLKRQIISRRCSEVIVPKQLQLKGTLKSVYCRSIAERETLINLISNKSRERYSKIIRVGLSLFNHEKPKQYIKKVNLQSSEIGIDFNRHKLGPFKYSYCYATTAGQQTKESDQPVPKWNLTNPTGDYTFSILIDGHIAYKGKFKSLFSCPLSLPTPH